MPDTFKYDVFISYSHADENWVVNTLLPTIEDAGIKACIDFRDFDVGKMALFNMQDAAKESHHTVLVLTRNWLKSEWSLFEALVGGTKDPAGLQEKIIPLLCEAGIENDIHDFIAMRTWVDFVRKDREEIAWQQLFKALDKSDAPIPDSQISKEPTNWHLKHRYALTGNFTGRESELNTLTTWLEEKDDPLFILRALGGFGKSALTWHWLLNKVDRTKWTKAVWWSFYEGDASFQNFLDDTLKYLLGEDAELPSAPRLQVEILLKELEKEGILLVMDGFERVLRAYSGMSAAYQEDDEDKKYDERDLDCVSPAADDFLRGLASSKGILQAKILMTTRLRPRAVEGRSGLLNGCLEKELLALAKDDAVAFFQNQGIKRHTRGDRSDLPTLRLPPADPEHPRGLYPRQSFKTK